MTSPSCVQCKCIQDARSAVLMTPGDDDVTVGTMEKGFIATTVAGATPACCSGSDDIWQKADESSTCYASYLDYKYPRKKEKKVNLTTFKNDVSNGSGARVSPKRGLSAGELRSPKNAEQCERLLGDDSSSSDVLYTTKDMSELLRSSLTSQTQLPTTPKSCPAKHGNAKPQLHDDVIKTPHSKVYTTPNTSFFRLPPISSRCTPLTSSSLSHGESVDSVDHKSSTSGSYYIDGGAELCNENECELINESSV